MSDFTNRIDSLLEEQNLKRSDLCKATGINESVIRAWIKRDSIPNADFAIKVAKFFGVSVEWLINGEISDDEPRLHLSDQEEEIIQIFRAMPQDKKDFMLNNARFLLKQEEEKKNQKHSAEA